MVYYYARAAGQKRRYFCHARQLAQALQRRLRMMMMMVVLRMIRYRELRCREHARELRCLRGGVWHPSHRARKSRPRRRSRVPNEPNMREAASHGASQKHSRGRRRGTLGATARRQAEDNSYVALRGRTRHLHGDQLTLAAARQTRGKI